jgi:hypothetical protein
MNSVLKFVSTLPGTSGGEEVAPRGQQHRHTAADTGGWGTLLAQPGRTFRVTCILEPDQKPKGQQDRALWLLFLASNAMHISHLKAISSFQKDSSC